MADETSDMGDSIESSGSPGVLSVPVTGLNRSRSPEIENREAPLNESQTSENNENGHTSDESEESEDHSETSESDDGDEEEEPLFKYARVTQLPKTFFHKEAVSAVHVAPTFYAFATHSGVLHLARKDWTAIRTTRIHRASIIDIDSDGSSVATASLDGTVVISSLKDPQNVVLADFNRPVYCVALDPNYETTKSYVSGGTAGTVVVSAKGWLKARSDTVIHQESSTIVAIKWIGSKIVWFSDDGISVYDNALGRIVHKFSRLPNSPRGDLYRPRVHFEGDHLYVGWAWAAMVLNLETLTTEKAWRAEWIISGIMPAQDKNSLLLLCTNQSQEPQLQLHDAETFEQQYVDELALQGYDSLAPNDYFMVGGSMFLIVSARDGVKVDWRDNQDHIDWLIERGRYLEAYEASSTLTDRQARQDIAFRAVNILINDQKWPEAATLLSNVLDKHETSQWVHWSKQFMDAGQYNAIGQRLPVVDLQDIPTKLLVWAAENDQVAFAEYLDRWPIKYFDGAQVISKLESLDRLSTKRDLARLYLLVSDPSSAVENYLRVDDSAAFRTVEHYHLWAEFSRRLVKIVTSGITHDTDGANGEQEKELVQRIAVLVENRMEVSPKTVVAEFEKSQGHDRLVYLYLKRLTEVEEYMAKDFADLLVRVYAEYSRTDLMAFLTRHDSYDLSRAISICEERGYTNELVYLFGKVGRPRKALDIIVNDLKDPKRAVELVSQYNDPDLWARLMDYSKDKPEFILRLLHSSHVRPARLLAMVDGGLRIPGLKVALQGLFIDQTKQLALSQGALAIVNTEAQTYMRMLNTAKFQGYKIDPESVDYNWGEPALIVGDNLVDKSGLVSELENYGSRARGPPNDKSGWFSNKIHRLGFLLGKASKYGL